MLYIKRKTQVKPTTGTIIDSASIKDKKKNTYSARILDNKENASKELMELQKRQILKAVGLGDSQLPRISGKDINSIDLNGFGYLSGCNAGGTAMNNGYMLQLTYTATYKVQFYIGAAGGGVLQYRKMDNGTWNAWANV